MTQKQRQVTVTSASSIPEIAAPSFDLATAVAGLVDGGAADFGAAAMSGASNSFLAGLSGDESRTDRKAQEKGRDLHGGRGDDAGSAYPEEGEHAWFDDVEEFEDPEIRHDHGFLEGWDDRNDNGVRDEDDWRATRTGAVDESLREEATAADYALLAKWVAMLEGAECLRPDLVDATAAYRHFLFGGGAPWTFSYDRFLQNDSSGAVAEEAAIDDAEYAVLSAHDEQRAPAPVDPGEEHDTSPIEEGPHECPVEEPSPPEHAPPPDAPALPPASFRQQSAPVTVGAGGRYPYPGTENWQKAIGGHPMWIQTEATVTSDVGAGERHVAMDVTLKMEDMYNFNPGQSDIATGTLDAENGRLAVVGLGSEFLQRGEACRHVEVTHPLDRWELDDNPGSVDGAPGRAGQRRPDGSRGNPGAR